MNGHVGRDADGYGGMGFGIRNAEGERILEFGDAVCMVDWWCATHSSRRKTTLITYKSAVNRSMIDYLMVRKTDCCLVKSVAMKPQKKKIVKFVPKSRVWKLKD